MSVLSFFAGLERPWFSQFFNKCRTHIYAKPKTGHVHIVGAGPGDPELLTVKALKALQTADVVLYDWLVSDEIIANLPPRCRRVFVGKRSGKHSMPQQTICRLLSYYAGQGLNVVRLKGGDPSIFARINEEADALSAANIPFAIIPGITTACAASAYTGIPLTCRGVAKSVTFLTAQFANPKQQPNWQRYQYIGNNDDPTLVVYMGLNRLAQLTTGLGDVGWPSTTPITIIENATTEKQKVLLGNLANIDGIVNKNSPAGPTLIVIGDVIAHSMPINKRLYTLAKNEQLTS